jgi:hypothetical protein
MKTNTLITCRHTHRRGRACRPQCRAAPARTHTRDELLRLQSSSWSSTQTQYSRRPAFTISNPRHTSSNISSRAPTRPSQVPSCCIPPHSSPHEARHHGTNSRSERTTALIHGARCTRRPSVARSDTCHTCSGASQPFRVEGGGLGRKKVRESRHVSQSLSLAAPRQTCGWRKSAAPHRTRPPASAFLPRR